MMANSPEGKKSESIWYERDKNSNERAVFEGGSENFGKKLL